MTQRISAAARVLIFLVRCYQVCFSPLLASPCKFYPSCSHYALEALRVHGAQCGSWLAVKRLLRCRPFSRGGVDFLPERQGATAPHQTQESAAGSAEGDPANDPRGPLWDGAQ